MVNCAANVFASKVIDMVRIEPCAQFVNIRLMPGGGAASLLI